MKNCFSLYVGLFIFLFLVFPFRAGLGLENKLVGLVSIDEIETIFMLKETGDGLYTLLLQLYEDAWMSV
jgi:hypothetical protein